MGLYPDLPPIPVAPGYEVSGRVDATGAGINGNWTGRNVLALTRFGGYSDTICVPPDGAREPCGRVRVGGALP